MHYRFSALDTFRQCPTKYKFQYKEFVRAPFSMLWLVNGTIFHAAVEDFYKTGEERCFAGRQHWAEWFENNGISQPWNAVRDMHNLWEVQRGLLEPFRNGEIVSPDGTPYKKPTATTAFRNLKAKSNYDKLKRQADSWQKDVTGIYFRPQDSLSEAFADCMDWLTDYRHPKGYGKSLHSELKFLIDDPWGNTHEGSMDQVFELEDEDGYAIHDYKTSKTEKKMVELDPQLNVYAYAGKQLFGEYPKYVSLHYVRTGNVVKAKIDPEKVESIYNTFVNPVTKSIQFAVENDVWLKHSPEVYNSPCSLCEYYLSGMCNAEYREESQ